MLPYAEDSELGWNSDIGLLK